MGVLHQLHPVTRSLPYAGRIPESIAYSGNGFEVVYEGFVDCSDPTCSKTYEPLIIVAIVYCCNETQNERLLVYVEKQRASRRSLRYGPVSWAYFRNGPRLRRLDIIPICETDSRYSISAGDFQQSLAEIPNAVSEEGFALDQTFFWDPNLLCCYEPPQGCPDGFSWDEETCECLEDDLPPIEDCPEGEYYDTGIQACVPFSDLANPVSLMIRRIQKEFQCGRVFEPTDNWRSIQFLGDNVRSSEIEIRVGFTGYGIRKGNVDPPNRDFAGSEPFSPDYNPFQLGNNPDPKRQVDLWMRTESAFRVFLNGEPVSFTSRRAIEFAGKKINRCCISSNVSRCETGDLYTTSLKWEYGLRDRDGKITSLGIFSAPPAAIPNDEPPECEEELCVSVVFKLTIQAARIRFRYKLTDKSGSTILDAEISLSASIPLAEIDLGCFPYDSNPLSDGLVGLATYIGNEAINKVLDGALTTTGPVGAFIAQIVDITFKTEVVKENCD